MKNYVKATILLCIIFVIAMTLYAVILWKGNGSSTLKNEEILLLNHITETAEDNWNDLDKLTDMTDIDETKAFIILGSESQVLYKSEGYEKLTAEAQVASVESAIKMGYPYRYIVVDNNVVGSAILLENGSEQYRSNRLRFFIGFGICGITFLIGVWLFGIYVKRRVITPFDRMSEFAGRVAEGNLDDPLLMEKDNMFGAFTESFDIMREELSESRKREVELQRKEKELIASLSHDLKTPITGIKLTTELLKAKLLKSVEQEKSSSTKNNDAVSFENDINEKLDNIYMKADQIDMLVSDLFSSTLEDLGEFKVNCQDEESSILNDIIKKNDSKGLVSSSDIPKLLICLDSKRMSQVIGNVISNSYKYAGTKIDVDYSVVDDYLEMIIRDYGSGVSTDELELITNKFYRGKNAKSDNKDGSGLGLYIAKSLMLKMNGELECTSDDKGFSVTLMIPISK